MCGLASGMLNDHGLQEEMVDRWQSCEDKKDCLATSSLLQPAPSRESHWAEGRWHLPQSWLDVLSFQKVRWGRQWVTQQRRPRTPEQRKVICSGCRLLAQPHAFWGLRVLTAGNQWKKCRTGPGKDQLARVVHSEEILGYPLGEIWVSFVFKVILVCYFVLLQSLLWEVGAFGHGPFQKEGGMFCLMAWAKAFITVFSVVRTVLLIWPLFYSLSPLCLPKLPVQWPWVLKLSLTLFAC